jgi:phage replication O-like protein O
LNLEQPVVNYNGAPKIEDGYTRIANELLEAIIAFKFSSRQLCIMFCVIRATYGYNKKSDAISGWQIAKMCNIDRSHISKSITELIAMNVLFKHETGRQSHGFFVRELSINKYYDTWTTVAKTAPLPKQPPLQNHGLTVAKTATVTVAKREVQPLPKQPTHKDISKYNKDTKDNICNFDLFWKTYPKKVGKDLAIKTWHKKSPNINEVLRALRWQVDSEQWIKGFIPNPATYLNEGRWQDEPIDERVAF